MTTRPHDHRRLAITRAIAGLMFMVACAGAIEPNMFPTQRVLEPPESSSHDIASFEFDESLFAAANGGYTNLRIFDETGAETPFLVRTQKRLKMVTDEHRVTLKETGLQTLADNAIEVTFEKKTERTGPFPSLIEINTRIKNFEKQVSVQGSLDGSTWETLAENQPIFDYSRFMDIRNTRVTLKPNRSLFYKVRISNISESQESPYTRIAKDERSGAVFSEVTRSEFRRVDFRIENIRFIETRSREVETTRIERLYAVTNIQTTHDEEKKTTVITFDGGHIPLTHLTVLTDSSNFSRRVIVEASNTEDGWRTLTTTTLRRIRLGSVNQDHVKLTLPATSRYAQFRVTIHNQDNPALAITGIEARGEVCEVLFLHNTDRSYRLLYTDEDIAAPRYDIAAVLSQTSWKDTDKYKLGEAGDNDDFDGSRPVRVVSARTFMIIAIILVVLVLAWLISKSVKQLEVEE